MTWLRDLPPARTDWDRLALLLPDVFDALTELQRTHWSLVDPVLLELCRLRMATLHGSAEDLVLRSELSIAAGLGEEKVAALNRWPTSPVFSLAERACLALTEQFVIAASGITDEQVREVLVHLSASECYALINALWVMEGVQKLCLTLGIEPTGEALGLTDLGRRHRSP